MEISGENIFDFKNNLRREYLLTNRLGGYAMGTVYGIMMRKYHGLLVAPRRPPLDRMVLLNKIEETVEIRKERICLDSNIYADGIVYPYGYKYLEQFSCDAWISWRYNLNGVRLEKSIGLLPDHNTLYVKYRLLGDEKNVKLRLRPLLSIRNHHTVQKSSANLTYQFRFHDGILKTGRMANTDPALYLKIDRGDFAPEPLWYYNFLYTIDREKGEPWNEDLYSPGVFEINLTPETAVVFVATDSLEFLPALPEAETAIRQRYETEHGKGRTDLTARLCVAADSFLVRRKQDWTVIAGYPWFTDWGRDTMIALPGLTLATGRYDIGRSIIRSFLAHISRGMIPNRFPDDSPEPSYNTVDGTLWLPIAAYIYEQKSGDRAFIRDEVYANLKEILEHHCGGTRYGIKVDPNDGLLHSGEEGSQLTWMDVKIEATAVTPRVGKPVEIQALWYNTLRITEYYALQFDDKTTAAFCRNHVALIEEKFIELFWYEAGNYLFDVIDGPRRDSSLRPNQVYALGLPFPLVSGPRARLVMEAVRSQLLTPAGLRTLSPNDRGYRGVYDGNLQARDLAYHQGTVWPFLLGAYFNAYFNTYGRGEEQRREVTDYLRRLLTTQLGEGCLGGVSEICDGEQPHGLRGCPAQAWSVAELLRIIIDEGLEL